MGSLIWIERMLVIPRLYRFLLSFHPHHARNRSAEEGDDPAGINAQADPVKHPVHGLGFVGQGGNQCQQEVESHPPQRSDAGDVVPFGRLAVRMGEQIHLVCAEVIAQQADAENDQMLPVQSLTASAENRPGVENKGQVHPDDRLQ